MTLGPAKIVLGASEIMERYQERGVKAVKEDKKNDESFEKFERKDRKKYDERTFWFGRPQAKEIFDRYGKTCKHERKQSSKSKLGNTSNERNWKASRLLKRY